VTPTLTTSYCGGKNASIKKKEKSNKGTKKILQKKYMEQSIVLKLGSDIDSAKVLGQWLNHWIIGRTA